MLSPVYSAYKNAYSGLSRSTWFLTLAMLINRSGTMVVPFMTLYLTSPEMGYSISQAGFVFGLFGLGAFTGAYFGGKLTDRIGFYPVQVIALFGGGVFFFILGQMKSYPLICLFTFVLSFVNEAFRPANATAIAFYSKEHNRTRSYALNRLAINVGWAIGSAMGGLLARINYELLFWVDGATNISAAGLVWFFLKPAKIEYEREDSQKRAPVHSAYQDRTYLIFIFLTMLFASCFFQLFTNLPVFFNRDLHFSEPLIGLLLALNGIIIAIIEMVLIYKLEGRRQSIFYITTGVFLIALSFLMLTLPGIGVRMAFAMIITVTLGEILSHPFLNSFWISRTRPENRGQYAGLYTMSWAAAQTLGPIGGSLLADHYGFVSLWLLAGILCLLVSFFYSRLKKYS